MPKTISESYAARLYELLKDVTNEVAGRAESMSMGTELYGFDGGPKMEMGMRKVTGADDQHKGAGRKIVFSAQNDPAMQTARSYEWGR